MSNIRYALLIVSLIFFGTYFYLHGSEAWADVRSGTSHYIISNQPDEMANYFFIKELVIDHSFGWYEPLNEIVSSQVHARSMTVINGRLEPIGFPFFIILVSLCTLLPTMIFGAGFFNIVAISLVPILAVAANFLLFGIVRRIWNERMGKSTIPTYGSFYLLHTSWPIWDFANERRQRYEGKNLLHRSERIRNRMCPCNPSY